MYTYVNVFCTFSYQKFELNNTFIARTRGSNTCFMKKQNVRNRSCSKPINFGSPYLRVRFCL